MSRAERKQEPQSPPQKPVALTTGAAASARLHAPPPQRRARRAGRPDPHRRRRGHFTLRRRARLVPTASAPAASFSSAATSSRPPQVASLLREADRIGATPLFRCIDLEGGLVDRLRDVIAPMPSAAAVFATGKRNLYRQHGWLIAREARALGFNTVFAPVLDLALPESASVLRTRVVSASPGASSTTPAASSPA